ncbi:MAG: hypothetical protein WCW68_10645 [Methanothrix sp.]
MTANIPTSFGFSTFIRVLLPGFIFSLLCTYFVLPIIPLSIIDKILLLSLLDKILIWAITGMLFGIIISSLDYYIYRFFTGSGILPKFIWDGMYKSLIFEFKKLINDYDIKLEKLSNTEDTEEYRKLNHDLVNMSNKLRQLPFNMDKLYTYPVSPTRLGNVINEYESYPKMQYGMNFNVFWSRLWHIMSKDSRDDLDFRGAKADFLIYLLAIWIIFIPFVTYSFYDSIGSDVVLIILLYIIITLVLYDVSVLAHENYGSYVKAAFDTYRIDLAKKLDIPISLCPKKEERSIWLKYKEFLEHYEGPESIPELNDIKFR